MVQLMALLDLSHFEGRVVARGPTPGPDILARVLSRGCLDLRCSLSQRGLELRIHEGNLEGGRQDAGVEEAGHLRRQVGEQLGILVGKQQMRLGRDTSLGTWYRVRRGRGRFRIGVRPHGGAA